MQHVWVTENQPEINQNNEWPRSILFSDLYIQKLQIYGRLYFVACIRTEKIYVEAVPICIENIKKYAENDTGLRGARRPDKDEKWLR